MVKSIKTTQKQPKMSKTDNFKGKQNTNGFKENPENINKEGKNRKSFSSINKDLIEKGIEPLKKKDLINAYELIFNSDEEELKTISKDPSTPYGLKLIITELNDKKTRSKAMADYRDYMFGKAQQNIDTTSGGEAIKPIIINLGEGVEPKK